MLVNSPWGLNFHASKEEKQRDHNSLNIEGMLQQCSVCHSGKGNFG
jgi:hypothetical protein